MCVGVQSAKTCCFVTFFNGEHFVIKKGPNGKKLMSILGLPSPYYDSLGKLHFLYIKGA